MVPDIDQSVVSPHVKNYWKQATYRRISQCGELLFSVCVRVFVCLYLINKIQEGSLKAFSKLFT